MADGSNGGAPRRTVGDFVVDRLAVWGVRSIYGYPGDGINGVLGALRRARESVRLAPGREPPRGTGIEFVQVAHEGLASFMACAHAKFTGRVGVCMSTGGPGAIQLLNGLYDARLDHQPVVAIVGQQALTGLGGSVQQEVDLHTLLEDVASAYLETIVRPEQARHVIDRAFRIALGERTVTAIILPHDVQREPEVAEPPREHGTLHSTPGWTPPRALPRDGELQRAAELLNEGRRVAMLVGAGALGAGDEVAAVAARLGAGVAQALRDVGYARYAELLGLAGRRVDRPDDLGEALDAAFAAGRPFVLDAVVDAAVRTVPPTLEPEQREHIAAALAAGDPDAPAVPRQLAVQGARLEEE